MLPLDFHPCVLPSELNKDSFEEEQIFTQPLWRLMSYFEFSFFFFSAKKRNEEESDSSALWAQEQMEAAYCLLMKVTVFGPSCGEDRTSCAIGELQNRAACPVTEILTHRAAPRKAQEANPLLWFKGTVHPNKNVCSCGGIFWSLQPFWSFPQGHNSW